ncbi:MULTISPECIES: T9SS type A sorting domain-containing protein [Reichenbachiella]|uniref:Secretion system C-terminal sorting domain-containing protein n=1 Tax=Reichenbachiella agariperforans TaxID=156994 RepID=A0A1M6UZT3_REIAG|nr:MULTISPECIES: T9SS type A sorting domain-containing protein [Reichenbachiella]MBU2912408.1 T9SS type A sorting domain-containing protein [Reichenbachiella agariperforans]MBU2912976.1 T9SS type A sorting domain-containing protein [Reichenbachiella agariperforans]RJE72721.1 hypothetical protein BGP76_01790 [Reichenbachiella sp. MSK19-1]SHK74671.1 hypothetical protein SAMN04488028_10861 [Reichenbachiella agariperforans]
MKTTIKTIALTLMVACSSLAFAGEKAEKSEKVVSPELKVQIKATADSKVIVIFDKLEGEEVKVRIYDNYGALIYSDKKVEGAKYAKAFDLSAYPAGNYAYTVSNDVYSVKKTIALK